jgi:AcrR family transcriptional regulator
VRTSKELPKRQRGRPRQFDPDDVLDRVRAVFLEKGYSAASLDDLAGAAGLNRPSLYAAFGDKEQLYIQALRRYGMRTRDGLEAILARPVPIEERLVAAYAAAIKVYCAPPTPPGCMIIGTAATEAPTHPKIAAVAAMLLGEVQASLRRAFERATSDGEIAAEPKPAARARLASAVFDTLAVRARLGSTATELRAFVQSMVPLICK